MRQSRPALCPVLTKYPLRPPQLYAIYVSRKHLPLKIRTFIDQLIEFTHIPRPWDDPVTDGLKSIKATPAVSLALCEELIRLPSEAASPTLRIHGLRLTVDTLYVR